jgi:hypothetical protein
MRSPLLVLPDEAAAERHQRAQGVEEARRHHERQHALRLAAAGHVRGARVERLDVIERPVAFAIPVEIRRGRS